MCECAYVQWTESCIPRVGSNASFLFQSRREKKLRILKMDLTKLENWGPNAWRTLHAMSLSYPNAPTETDKLNMKTLLFQFARFLPCKLCGKHFYEVLQRRIVPDSSTALNSRKNFVNFVIDAHNEVNERLGKTVYSRYEAYKMITTSQCHQQTISHLIISILIVILILMCLRTRKACLVRLKKYSDSN